MAGLKEKIQEDLTASMREKDVLKVSTLRLLKAAIMKWEVAGEKKEADCEVILGIIGKEVKQRKDSAEQFRSGGRPEMADKEEREMKILEGYLPEQLDEDAVRSMVIQTIEELGATSKADMGRVMGVVMSKVKGRADGGVVQGIVRTVLE